MDANDVYILIPGTWEKVILYAKRDLRLQNREIMLDYLGGPNVIPKILKSGREKQRRKLE